MEEIWKDVLGYEGFMEASNLGNIRNAKRLKNLSQHLGIDGLYYNVLLIVNKNRKWKNVSRLIISSFKGKSDLPEVDHINSIKTDNRLENLRYCTHRQNILYSKQRDYPCKKSGVSFKKRENYWEARIQVNGKRINLGCYKTELEASEAYQKALLEVEKGNIPVYRNPRKKSKYKNVNYHKKNNSWTVYKKGKYLGSFKTENEAYNFTKTL